MSDICQKPSVSAGENIFQLKKSNIYCWYLTSIHLFSLFSVWLVAPVYPFFIFFLFIFASFLYYFFRQEKIISLQYDKKKEWILKMFNGEMLRAELLPSSVMMRYFLILHFKCASSADKKMLLLFSDHFSKADFQALRRCVRMGYL